MAVSVSGGDLHHSTKEDSIDIWLLAGRLCGYQVKSCTTAARKTVAVVSGVNMVFQQQRSRRRRESRDSRWYVAIF